MGAGKEVPLVRFEPFIAYKYMADISTERHDNVTEVSPRYSLTSGVLDMTTINWWPSQLEKMRNIEI